MPDGSNEKMMTLGEDGVGLLLGSSSELNTVFLEAGSLRISKHDATDIAEGRIPEQLFFEAVMARVEVNGNKDELTAEQLQEIAATLSHTPIDEEHRQGIVQGTILSARYDPTMPHPKQKGRSGALLASCVTWPRRFPKQAKDLLAGLLKFSIESSAESVKCSACGSLFSTKVSENDYCACLKGRKVTGNAVSRLWQKSRGIGAAFTYNPAGTDCATIPGSIMLVASYDEENSPLEVVGMLTASTFLEGDKLHGNVKKSDHASHTNKGIALEAKMTKDELKKLLATYVTAAKDDKDGDAPDKEDASDDDKAMNAMLKAAFGDVVTHARTSADIKLAATMEEHKKIATEALTAAVAKEKSLGDTNLLAERRVNALASLGVEDADKQRDLVATLSDAQWSFVIAGYAKSTQATQTLGANLLATTAIATVATPPTQETQSGATQAAAFSFKTAKMVAVTATKN